MVRVKVAIGLLVASLILLIIYGADAILAQSSPNHKGFLELDESVRGGGLGGGAFVMSLIAFVLSWKRPSSMVAILLFVNGGLIIAGMLALIATGALASANMNEAVRTIGFTMALGAILVGLGVWKAFGDRRKVGKEQPSR